MVPLLTNAVENLRMIYENIADALTGFTFDQTEVGFMVHRDDAPENGFLILGSEESSISEGTVEIIKNYKKVYVPSSLLMWGDPFLGQLGYSPEQQSLAIFHKNKGLAPSLFDEILDAPFSIKTFSFSQRGKVDQMYERLDLLPSLITRAQGSFFSRKGVNSQSAVVERIPRALLHLFNGKFWVLEDYYENFLACAITVPNQVISNRKGLSVFYLLTLPDQSKYGNALLANIELQEKCDFLFIYDEADQKVVDENYGYELLETFKLYVNV